MKNWLKVLCLVLVLAFVLPALVACSGDGGGEEDNGKDDGGIKLELPDSIDEDTDYKQQEFTMYSVEDMFQKKYFFADKTTGDGMNDSLYQRQQNVQRAIGVQLKYKAAEGSGGTAAYEVYATEVKNAIKSGQEKYQLVLTHAYYALPDLITSDSLLDLKELDSLSFNKDYWNKNIMDQVAYKGSYYLGYSDFNLATTYVVAFNKSLYNNFSSELNNVTMYDYVKNGEWTLSQMTDIAELAYQDKGGSSSDIYGITGELWVPFCGFIQSSNESIVVKNEKTGKYQLSSQAGGTTTKRKLETLLTRLKALDRMEESYFWKISAFTGSEPSRVTLSSGRAFMQLMSINELIALKEQNVKFGVLPYPLYESKQYNKESSSLGYRSLNWAGYICVPANVANKDMIGDVIECLSFYSGDVTTYYYEKLLGRKVSEAPEDADMLDIVWDSLCSDFGIAYSMIDTKGNFDALVYAIPRCIMDGKAYSTWLASYESPAQKALDTVVNR